ncbi:hypothetical protein LQZ21_01155 [Treponema sp. TIM-1]|uniref:hypothetical protein n=1 Tax=Treponema sp. TIM-1 TaxID=2898417 RepID=UPI0039814670
MKKLLYILGITVVFLSCGVDDYIYLEQVDRSEITITLNTLATVRLPPPPQRVEDYFRNYAIYYRIYVSGNLLEVTIEEGMLSTVNSYLYSDYSTIQPYTNPDTSTSTNVGTLFTNRKYYTLDTQFLPGTYTIDFGQDPPVINGNPIQRSSAVYNPAPDRLFRNQTDLYSAENASRNSDVQPTTGGSGPMYTYVAMYVVAVGVSDNYSTIYSKPTFIGVFRLP